MARRLPPVLRLGLLLFGLTASLHAADVQVIEGEVAALELRGNSGGRLSYRARIALPAPTAAESHFALTFSNPIEVERGPEHEPFLVFRVGDHVRLRLVEVPEEDHEALKVYRLASGARSDVELLRRGAGAILKPLPHMRSRSAGHDPALSRRRWLALVLTLGATTLVIALAAAWRMAR